MKIELSNYELLDLCLEQHQKLHDKKKDMLSFLGLEGFHKENHLSLYFGRLFGHTTYIKYYLSKHPDSIMVHNNFRIVDSLFDKNSRNNPQLIGKVEHWRGKTFPIENVKTVFADRSLFKTSNYGIIEHILSVTCDLYRNRQTLNQDFRIVILG